jgi:L-threonylcarbamoyladenylate synthase
MDAQVLQIDWRTGLSLKHRERIREVVQSGGLLIFPTDTVYGLGCDAFHDSAIQRIYALKGRSPERPFSVHLGSIEEIKRYAVVTKRQQARIEKLLPGPYTIVLDATPEAPPACVSAEGKIGLRVPKSRSFQLVYEAGEKPLVGTSVNRHGEPPLTDINAIVEQFGESVELLVATDEPMSHQSSTVVDLTVEPPKALRGELPNGLLS